MSWRFDGHKYCHHLVTGMTIMLVGFLTGCVTMRDVPTPAKWEGDNREQLYLANGGKGQAVDLPVWNGKGKCGVDGMFRYTGKVAWTVSQGYVLALSIEDGEDVEASPERGGPMGGANWGFLSIAPCGYDPDSALDIYSSKEIIQGPQ